MSNSVGPHNDSYMQRLNGRAPWVAEFNERWAVPTEITSDPELEDISWHNDVSPSFAVFGVPTPSDSNDPNATDFRLWSDHPDPDMRELEQAERFAVVAHHLDGDYLYRGDDVNEAIRILKEAVKR